MENSSSKTQIPMRPRLSPTELQLELSPTRPSTNVYISTNFQNVNKPSTLHSYLQKYSWLLKAV